MDKPVVALVDAAVASTRREYQGAVPVHVDLSLHRATLTRIAQPSMVQTDRTEVIESAGVYALYDLWLSTVAEAFVRQSRFDPLHVAETEQMLLDRLGGWLAANDGRRGFTRADTLVHLPHFALLEPDRLLFSAKM